MFTKDVLVNCFFGLLRVKKEFLVYQLPPKFISKLNYFPLARNGKQSLSHHPEPP